MPQMLLPNHFIKQRIPVILSFWLTHRRFNPKWMCVCVFFCVRTMPFDWLCTSKTPSQTSRALRSFRSIRHFVERLWEYALFAKAILTDEEKVNGNRNRRPPQICFISLECILDAETEMIYHLLEYMFSVLLGCLRLCVHLWAECVKISADCHLTMKICGKWTLCWRYT